MISFTDENANKQKFNEANISSAPSTITLLILPWCTERQWSQLISHACCSICLWAFRSHFRHYVWFRSCIFSKKYICLETASKKLSEQEKEKKSWMFTISLILEGLFKSTTKVQIGQNSFLKGILSTPRNEKWEQKEWNSVRICFIWGYFLTIPFFHQGFCLSVLENTCYPELYKILTWKMKLKYID